MEFSQTSESMEMKKKGGMGKWLLLLVVIFLAGAAAYFLWYKTPAVATPNPNATTAEQQAQIQSLVSQVSKLMLLPNEEPSLALVSDPSKLTGQPFFKNAEKGDAVLIFVKAQKAVLYSPSKDKIVEVSQLAPAPEEKAAAK